MKVQVEEISPIERKLSIEVPPEQVRAELDRAYTQLSRHVKVAGFRPGKVPRRILEQKYREEVEDDVIQRVVERSYLTAISQNNVEAVSRPRVTNSGLKLDQPFTFEARVEVKPKINVKDYRELPLKRLERTVDPGKVTERLEAMRERASRLEPVEDRKTVHAGDFVAIDFAATIEGKPFPGSQAQDMVAEVAPGELVQSKIPALEGMEVGSAKEIDCAFPTDYQVEELRGKIARFHVTAKAIKRKVVPELNDDLAKEVGVESLEALRSKIQADLTRAAEANADSEERDALLSALIEQNPFEVPTAMVERTLEMMLEGAVRNLARGGLDPRVLNLDWNHLRDELRPRAQKEVKGSLLLEAVAQKENVQVSNEEVNARIEELAADAGQALSQVKKHFRDPSEREGLKVRIREEKTVEFLKAHAKYS